MSLPAAIKHIDVLCDAGLVRRERLLPDPMSEARAWLERNLAFWHASFDALGEIVDGDE